MSAWKPKQKELTAEEAVAAAKKELAADWIGSTPLLAAIEASGVAPKLHVLDPELKQGYWLFLGLDPSQPSTAALAHWIKELSRRYRSFQVRILLCVAPPYPPFEQPELFEEWLHTEQINETLIIDRAAKIQRALGLAPLPGWALFGPGLKGLGSGVGPQALGDLEAFLQKVLRQVDPGLPLSAPAPIEVHPSQAREARSLKLGQELKGPTEAWSSVPGEGGPIVWKAVQDGARLDLKVSGVTSLSAILKFPPNAQVEVKVNDAPVLERNFGRHLRATDLGTTLLKTERSGLLQILSGLLPERTYQVTLQFSNASQNPIELFAIRTEGLR